MTLICYETEENLDNPFYMVCLLINDKERGRIARQNIEIALSRNVVKKMPIKEFPKSLEEISNPLIYTLQEANGTENQFGYVQWCWGWKKTGSIWHLTEKQAKDYFPRIARNIKNEFDWIEKTGNKWKKSEWAQDFYKGLRAGRK